MKRKQLFRTTQRMNFWWTFFLAAMFLGQMATAQNGSISKPEMDKLSAWIGEWKGEGWQIDQQTRERVTFSVEEKVESKLDGLAFLVEGKGMNGSQMGHHAMAMIYYNVDKGYYEFHSLVMQGRATLAKGEFNDQGAFVWGFDVPQGKIRYTIKIEGDTWTESGAFSMDGNNWFPIMEMKLKRIK
ncbi:MAG TPA: hypothetical protein VIN11_00155 [Roseivirga sp.]